MKEKNNPNAQNILYLAIGLTIAFMLYIAFVLTPAVVEPPVCIDT